MFLLAKKMIMIKKTQKAKQNKTNNAPQTRIP